MGSNSNLMTLQIRDVVEAKLGIRFRPTDEELIVNYLAAAKELETNKVLLRSNIVVDYDVYSCPPWLLPRHLFEYSVLQNDMYFISERRPKTEGGSKVDRNAGAQGFWYYNSKRIPIKNCAGEVIGIKCSLNYMIFKVAESNNKKSKKKEKEKTSWIMHEYTLQSSPQDPAKFQDVVLCHIYDTAEDKQPKRVTIIDEEEEEAVAAQVEEGQNSLVFSSASLCTSSHSYEPLPPQTSPIPDMPEDDFILTVDDLQQELDVAGPLVTYQEQHDHTNGNDAFGELLLNMLEYETMTNVDIDDFLIDEDPSNGLV